MLTRDRDGQAGFSLVELLVSMTILSIILAGLSSFVVAIVRTSGSTTERLNDLAQTRTGIDAVTRSLRAAVRIGNTAPILQIAQENHLRFIANFNDGDPILLDYEVMGTDLVESRWAADAGSAPNFTFTPANPPTSQRRVVRNLDFTAGTGIFTYVDVATCPNDPLTCATLDVFADPTTGLAAADRNVVDAITITMAVLGPGSFTIPAAEIRTVVTLRNSAYVPDP